MRTRSTFEKPSRFRSEGGESLYADIAGSTIVGIEGVSVTVEVDVSAGLPGLEITGMGDTAVRESRHRVRSAIRNSGFELPPRRITVNLAPAAVHKEGSQLDLPIALGILAASGAIVGGERLKEHCFLGELALDGSLRPVRGALAMALSAKDRGYSRVIVPRDNGAEVSCILDLAVRTAGSLREVVDYLGGKCELNVPLPGEDTRLPASGIPDFRDIKGQAAAKRALEVAAAGGHNLLMLGSPGAGKSMLARAMPGILPDLTPEEALVVTRIASVAGILPPGSGLLRERPFRAPHHTITATALIGGGAHPVPGEITLAHRGVLFLDELPEFPPSVLNALRQPLEDGRAVVARSKGTYVFPCRFVLLAAMNPCPCGFYGDPLQECSCTEHARRQYVSRISGPFLDRIDLHLEVPRVTPGELLEDPTETSAQVKERVAEARRLQAERLKGTGMVCNSEMGPREVSALLSVSGQARKLLMQAYSVMRLSARTYYKVLKVAASIADLAGSPRVEEEHVAEALSYRPGTVWEG